MLDLNEIMAACKALTCDEHRGWTEGEEFIARSRTWLPALVAELRTARSTIDYLQVRITALGTQVVEEEEHKLKLNLDETMRDYQVAADEGWQGCGETAARLLEQIPVLVAELRQARLDMYLARMGQLETALEVLQLQAEVERLRALVPTAKLLRELANWSDDALPYSAAEALALARRIKEANTDDATVDL